MPSSRRSPGLRKRQLTPDVNDEKIPLLAPVSSSSRTKSTISRRYVLVLVSISIAAVFILRTSLAGTDIPQSYALCSRDGNNIYTVDTVAPRVQCLVVQDGKFVDTGSVGEHYVILNDNV